MGLKCERGLTERKTPATICRKRKETLIAVGYVPHVVRRFVRRRQSITIVVFNAITTFDGIYVSH